MPKNLLYAIGTKEKKKKISEVPRLRLARRKSSKNAALYAVEGSPEQTNWKRNAKARKPSTTTRSINI